MPRHSAWAILLLALLALGACASETPRDQVGVALRIEKVRSHLLAASENAAGGRWDLAAVHAAHPAEDMQPIDAVLSKRDAAADAALRAQLAAIREAVAAGNAAGTIGAANAVRVAGAIEAADTMLGAAARTIAGERTADPRFDLAVAAELLEMVETEYAEAVVDGRLVEVTEYQDAYAFLTRARALALSDAGTLGDDAPALRAAVDALAAAMPAITPPSAPTAAERVEALVDEARGLLVAAIGPAYGASATSDLSPLLAQLDGATAAIASRDVPAAAEALTAFRGTWTQVEGAVKTRTAEGYARIEKDLATATAALGTSPDPATATDAIARMRAEIAPLAVSTATYGVVDAAVILLREGVEALLVVAALLAFLARTGNASKRRWIWAGGGAGILASMLVAVLITLAFSASVSAGADREVLEGVTGLFAAAMLVYVSWWLHSKSSLASWQRYIREKGGAALANGSLIGLALIAFLAVFREGAETALFYLGMAPSIAMTDLVLGLLLATAALVVIGVLVLAFEMRIPIRPFFLGTSVLVYYLAFKFVGTGVHALQIAGAVPASPRAFLPDVDVIGAFPTIETTVVQATLLAAALGWLIAQRRMARVAGTDPR